MGRRVERWERNRELRREQRRLDAIARNGATESQPAVSKAQAEENPLGREPGEVNTPPPEATNPLGRDPAEVKEMYRQQRIADTLSWLRGMAQSSGTRWF